MTNKWKDFGDITLCGLVIFIFTGCGVIFLCWAFSLIPFCGYILSIIIGITGVAVEIFIIAAVRNLYLDGHNKYINKL